MDVDRIPVMKRTLQILLFIGIAEIRNLQAQQCTKEDPCPGERDGGPIQLVEIIEDSVRVNDDALYDLMTRDELRGRHLMILSIAGEMRTGKSFIMNFFSRYLRYKGWKNPDWIDEEITIADKFKWQRGSKVVTQGILVSPEIFKVPLEDGSEAAVVLVDTQGLYDGHTSPDTNAKLMALSTVLSSYQILNVKSQINERDLEHIQLSTEVAKAATKDERGVTSRQLLQVLLFLIRDWDRDYEYKIGDCTSGYLFEFLNEKSRSETVQEVKDSVHEAFKKISCYLLPHPGKNATRSVGKLMNDELDDEFFEAAKKLCEFILHPKNISLKRNLNGQLATANDVLHMVGNMGKMFKSSGLPKVETLRKAWKRTNLIQKLNQSVSIYNTKIKELCDDIMTDEQLKSNHDKAFSAAAEYLEIELASECNKNITNEFRGKFKGECEDLLTSIQQRNKHRKGEKLLMESEEAVEKILEQYKRNIETSISSTHTDEEFILHHKRFKQLAIKSFNAEFGDSAKTFPAVKDKGDKLVREVDLAFSEANSARLLLDANIEKVKKCTLMLEQEFRSEADLYSDRYYEEIEAILRDIKKWMIEKYDAEMAENTEKNAVMKSKKKLNSRLDELVQHMVKRNQDNLDKKKRECQLIGKKYAEALEQEFEPILLEKYIEPWLLEKDLNQFVSVVRKDASFKNLPDWGQDIVLQEIMAKIQSLKLRNKRNEDFRSTNSQQTINTSAWAALSQAVYEIGKYLLKKLGF